MCAQVCVLPVRGAHVAAGRAVRTWPCMQVSIHARVCMSARPRACLCVRACLCLRVCLHTTAGLPVASPGRGAVNNPGRDSGAMPTGSAVPALPAGKGPGPSQRYPRRILGDTSVVPRARFSIQRAISQPYTQTRDISFISCLRRGGCQVVTPQELAHHTEEPQRLYPVTPLVKTRLNVRSLVRNHHPLCYWLVTFKLDLFAV